jgi:hypothetical protein
MMEWFLEQNVFTYTSSPNPRPFTYIGKVSITKYLSTNFVEMAQHSKKQRSLATLGFSTDTYQLTLHRSKCWCLNRE